MNTTTSDMISATMNSICEAMNAQTEEWRSKGAINYSWLMAGQQFVWATYPDNEPKTRLSGRWYRGVKGGRFTTAPRTFCYVVTSEAAAASQAYTNVQVDTVTR